MPPLNFVPPTSKCLLRLAPRGFGNGQVVIPQGNGVIEAALKKIQGAARFSAIASRRNLRLAQVDIVVIVELVASPCRITQNADQAVIWKIINRYCLNIGAKIIEISYAVAGGLRRIAQPLQKMDRYSGLGCCDAEKLDVGIDFFALVYLLLPVGKSARVPDRQGGEDRLGPSSPLALRETKRGYEPAAVGGAIRHNTSPVSMAAIVGRGSC